MKKKIFSFLLVIMLIGGITLLSYPTISNIINEYTNQSYINKYNKTTKSLSSQQKQYYLDKAIQYNKMVATEYYPANVQQKFLKISKSYDDILNFGDGLIGYISINKINVYLPIYHSTTPNALTKGAVHLIKTSFPIGQTDSHTVISAHSGFPTNKLFDDIDTLNIGDTFTLKIIDNTYYYKIIRKNIVKPDDISKIKIEKGKELVTLSTCYPYSVNSHRLLLTAERIKKESKQNSNITRTDKKENNIYIYMLFILLCIGYFIILILKKKGDIND